MPLAVSPCRALCSWSAVRGPVAAADLFACSGCGSQWAPDQAWTPVQADGTVPPEVLAVRRRVSGGRAGGAGSAGS